MDNSLVRLISQAQPHKVINFLAAKSGLTPGQLVATSLNTCLGVLFERFQKQVHLNNDLAELIPWLESFRRDLERPFCNFVSGKGHQAKYPESILERAVGETTLQNYLSDEPLLDLHKIGS